MQDIEKFKHEVTREFTFYMGILVMMAVVVLVAFVKSN
jgi:hypothetical protein